MLVDYNAPGQRYITCPSQDLIYGFGILDLSRGPVIVQVPDFGRRFFVFQATDQRTDAYADIGSMYGTKPGFYLLVGPDWHGQAPPRASTPRSAPPPRSAPSSPGCFKPTMPPTRQQSSPSFAKSWLIPCLPSTAQ